MDASTTKPRAVPATGRKWAAVEAAIAVAVILPDLFLPTLVVLGLAAVSLLLRREHASARP
jgi:hypothetical protein